MARNERSEEYPQLPDEFLIHIGLLVESWNRLEWMIAYALLATLFADSKWTPKGWALVANMTIPQKINALGSVLHTHDAALYEAYEKEIKGPLGTAQERRNAILHRSLFARDEGIFQQHVRAKKTPELFNDRITTEDLKKVWGSCDELYDALLTRIVYHVTGDPRAA